MPLIEEIIEEDDQIEIHDQEEVAEVEEIVDVEEEEEEHTALRRSRRTHVPKTVFTMDKLGGNPSWCPSTG